MNALRQARRRQLVPRGPASEVSLDLTALDSAREPKQRTRHLRLRRPRRFGFGQRQTSRPTGNEDDVPHWGGHGRGLRLGGLGGKTRNLDELGCDDSGLIIMGFFATQQRQLGNILTMAQTVY